MCDESTLHSGTCNICRRFQGRIAITDLQELRGKYNRHHIVPSLSWNELVQSAKSCDCCEIIFKGCKETFSQHKISQNEVTNCSIKFNYPRYLERADEDSCDKHITFRLKSGHNFEVEMFCADDDETNVPESWDYLPTLMKTSPATDSEEAMEKMKTWIACCVHEDEFCEAPDDSELPKRAIDVGLEDGIVKLVETDGGRGRYLCLSHCWGLEQIITTTTSTIEDRKKDIAWDELSKTFQDAILFTRRLGFRYIWIDSLCIIQDSAADWAIESAKMASVYSNGYLTIAGTKSSSGRGGLFNDTPVVQIAGQTRDNEDYSVYFRQRIDHQLDVVNGTYGHTSSERYYPLLTRAWVYQERMLSTRFLHFGHYEVFFECKTGVQCECYGISLMGDHEDEPAALMKLEYTSALESYAADYKGQAAEKVAYYGARVWRSMVCCYTALRLTKSKDRLVAFGGLAKQMSVVRKARYLAGLWEDTLQDDLLWTLRATNKYKTPRPEPRNAPTWSWASVECIAGSDYWDAIVFTDLRDSGMDEPRPRKHFTKIESCEVTAAETAVDDFGPIAQGKLTITGLIRKGYIESEAMEKDGDQRVVDYIIFGDLRLAFDPDYVLGQDFPDRAGSTVVCLRMSLIEEGSNLVSLVLRKVDIASNTYERIGTLTIRGQEGAVSDEGGIYETTEERTVVII